MNDTDRILQYLQEHGSITSYEIRVQGLSGNPSQRITELQDRGHVIKPERFQREGRPCVNYILISTNSSSCVGADKPELSLSGADITSPQQIPSIGPEAIRVVSGSSLPSPAEETSPELCLFVLDDKPVSTHMAEAA